MEIYRHHGMDEALHTVGTPQANMCQWTWSTSLGGNESFDRKQIAVIPAWGGPPGGQRYLEYQYEVDRLPAKLVDCC
jgi:hypothetical protein